MSRLPCRRWFAGRFRARVRLRGTCTAHPYREASGRRVLPTQAHTGYKRCNWKTKTGSPDMSDDFMLDTDDLERRMEGAIASLRTEFASLRTGRASASMLEPVMVDAYGAMTPINQVGTVNVPEPRMVTVNVWDKGLVNKVEKAIRESGLGINPQMNGTIIMLPIPELNEERRRELTKVAGTYAENARVAVRNVRRDGMDQIKKADTSEDDAKFWEGAVQELTDTFIKRVDDQLETKQEEIMQV
ncbi:ribosome recycling factor [Jannaschia sp. CCS1]|nr:ribosome recycling factor [Jannaschia sp. CCS1]